MNKKSFITFFLALACMISSGFSQIQTEQSIVVKIMGVPAEEKAKIDETYPVSKQGNVNMPFIGEIRAAGLDAAVLAKNIEARYISEGYYANPTIQVYANGIDVKPADQLVHIGGQVKATGPKPFTKGLTVYQAIQAAGGATEFGALNRVQLYRDGKQQTLDLKSASGKAVPAQPGDTIEVPQKGPFGG